MKRKIIFLTFFIMIFIIFEVSSFAYFIPTWSETDTTTEVNADSTTEDFLNIESQSAILIEQTTRKNTL